MKFANTVKEMIDTVAFAARFVFGDDSVIEALDAHAADTGGASHAR